MAMLVCDSCDFQTAHQQCLKLDKIPEDEWFCRNCEHQRRQSEEQAKKLRKTIRKKTKKPTKPSSKPQAPEPIDQNELIQSLKRSKGIYAEEESEEERVLAPS